MFSEQIIEAPRNPSETGFPLSAVVAPGYFGEVGSLQQATGNALKP